MTDETMGDTPNVDPLTWIDTERSHLWTDFCAAARRAAKRPIPDDPRYQRHWSMDMLSLVDRIRGAGALLGTPTQWGSLPYDAWPYFPIVEDRQLPDAAWEWLDEHARRAAPADQDRILSLLSHRPTKEPA